MSEPVAPLVRLLGLASSRLSEWMLTAQQAAGFNDIRPAHGAVFAHVPPEGIHLSELARRAGMTKQAMAELVSDLLRLGYLTRRADEQDRRRQVIAFTDRGWASVALALKTFEAQEQELAAELGERRMRELRVTLTRLLGLPL